VKGAKWDDTCALMIKTAAATGRSITVHYITSVASKHPVQNTFFVAFVSAVNTVVQVYGWSSDWQQQQQPVMHCSSIFTLMIPILFPVYPRPSQFPYYRPRVVLIVQLRFLRNNLRKVYNRTHLTLFTPPPFIFLHFQHFSFATSDLLGPFYGAIAVPSVTRCRCRGHRCAGGVRQ